MQLVSGDFPPYVGSELKNAGIASEIVTHAFAQMGDQVNIDYKPWKRRYVETLNHLYLATFPYTKNEKREQELYFSDAMYHLEEYFFTRSNANIRYWGISDLANLRVCKSLGYNLFGLNELLNNGTISLAQPKSMVHCFKMLKLGRVDLVMTNKVVAWKLVKEIFSDVNDITMLEKSFIKISHYLVISKTYPQGEKVIIEFNATLANLKVDGIIDFIQDKYINAQTIKL